MSKLTPFTPAAQLDSLSAGFELSVTAKLVTKTSDLRLALRLDFEVTGPMASLFLHSHAPLSEVLLRETQRLDELWKATCFEAFLQPKGGDQYWEINVSERGEWNVYHFAGYRDRRRREAGLNALEDFSFQISADKLNLQVSWPLDFLGNAGVQMESGFRLGLAAIIETTHGEKSYWALNHPVNKPDFHDARGFQLELAALPTRN